MDKVTHKIPTHSYTCRQVQTYKYPAHKHTQQLHYEELLVCNHPRLFPIITVPFETNHIKWQNEILHDGSPEL